MPDRPSDVKKKLDDLYRQTEDIRYNLIELHHMLTNTGFFTPKPQHNAPPQPVYVPPVAQPQYAPPVTPPPPVTQMHTPPPVVPPVTPPSPVTPPVTPPQQVYAPPLPTQQPKQHVQQPSPQPRANRTAPPEEKGFFERNPDLEKFIGERLITFIGIAILVIGIAFFVKYAIDQNWINKIGRTAIGILSGGILIGVAHRLRKSYTTFSSVLAGGGIATLYFTVTYAFQVYQLFSQPAALGILVVITLFTVLLSVGYDRKELAILAIIGGFASPLMVKTGEGNFVVLCVYMLILDIGMLVLAYYKKWNVITVLSFLFTILFYTVALNKDIHTNQHAHDHEAFLFATLFYLTFFIMNIINNVKDKRKFESFEILSLLSNTALYYAAGYFLLHHMEMNSMKGLFTLLVAAFNCVFAFLLFRRQEVDRNLVYFLVGMVITFVSLAGPVQLEGNHITLFWAAEAVLLLWFYYKSNLTVVKVFSTLLNVALMVSLLYNWMMVYALPGDTSAFMNKGFITTIGAVISLAVSSILLIRSKEEFIGGTLTTDDYRKTLSVAGVIILFVGGLLEMTQILSHTYSLGTMPVYWAAYTVLFIAAARLVIKPIRLEFLAWTLRFATILMLFGAVLFPHISVVDARDEWLSGAHNAFGPFMMHYVYLAGIFILGFWLLRDYRKNELIVREHHNMFLWLFSAVTIFLLSAELDHTMVMSYALNPENPSWRADAVQANIAHALSLSHKVGFPIIWGVCSFAMMIIGMREKNRQLRIISLVLFAGVVVKLILLGIFGESQAGKIIAFVLCGVILLLVSFMYQKLRKLIMDDTKTDNSKENETAA
jgi:hypothetical protein